jgi:hypothetical protein
MSIVDEKDLSATEHIEGTAHGLDPEAATHLTRHGANNQMDEAAKILEAAGQVNYTPEERKRVLRMIDIAVCVPMCLTYFIQQVCCGATESAGWLADATRRWTSLRSHTPPSSTSRRRPTLLARNTPGSPRSSTSPSSSLSPSHLTH